MYVYYGTSTGILLTTALPVHASQPWCPGGLGRGTVFVGAFLRLAANSFHACNQGHVRGNDVRDKYPGAGIDVFVAGVAMSSLSTSVVAPRTALLPLPPLREGGVAVVGRGVEKLRGLRT